MYALGRLVNLSDIYVYLNQEGSFSVFGIHKLIQLIN
jgi:hypothetical protein